MCVVFEGVMEAKECIAMKTVHRRMWRKAPILCYYKGWPEPYVYTIHDQEFSDSLPKIPYVHRININTYTPYRMCI